MGKGPHNFALRELAVPSAYKALTPDIYVFQTLASKFSLKDLSPTLTTLFKTVSWPWPGSSVD